MTQANKIVFPTRRFSYGGCILQRCGQFLCARGARQGMRLDLFGGQRIGKLMMVGKHLRSASDL